MTDELEFYEHKWNLVYPNWKREKKPYLKKDSGLEGELALKLLRKKISNGKVLDLGCGGGRNIILFSKAGFTVSGVDFSKKAVELAKQNCSEHKISAELVLGDVLNLKFSDSSFDCLLDFGLFHHLRKTAYKCYFKNILRVLRNDGYYVLYAFSSRSNKTNRFNPKAGRNWAVFLGHYYHYFSLSEIRKIFCRYFKIVKTELIREKSRNLAFYLIVMQKKVVK